MRIQSRIWLGIAASLAVSGVLAFFIFSSFHEIGDDLARGQKYKDIIQKAFALDILVATFGQESVQRHMQQFGEVRATLTKLLDGLESSDAREESLIRKIRRDNQELGPLLDQFLHQRAEEGGLQAELKKMLATQLWTKVRFIRDDTSRLMDISESRIVSAYKRAGITILFLLIALLGANVIISLISGRGIARAQKELRASEERFRRYFELGLIGMAITSPTKGMIKVNDEVCKILGYEREELTQKTWAELTHPDDLAANVAQFDRVMAGEIEGYVMDKRFIRKDGQVIVCTISVRALHRPGGSVDSFLTLWQDITERKQAEEALHESEQRYRTLFETSPDAIVVHRDGRFLDANQAALSLTGAGSFKELTRHTVLDFFSPPERKESTERMHLVKAGHKLAVREATLQRLDGQEAEVEFHTVPLDFRGAAAAQTIMHDLTARKQADENLRRTNERLQLLLRTLPVAVTVAEDPDCQCITTNAIGTRLFEVPEGVNVSASATQPLRHRYFHQGKELKPEELPMQMAIAGDREIGEMEIEAHLSSGRCWTALVYAAPLHDAYGKVIGGIGVSADITERKGAEEALQQRTLELQHLTETLEERVRERTEELADLSSRLVSAQENERLRVSYDLHDNVWQALVAIRFDIESLFLGKENWAAVQNKAKRVMVAMLDVVGKIRSMQGDLWPYVLDDIGLLATLSWYCRECEKGHPGLIIDIQDGVAEDEIPSPSKIVIYRVLQEALSNVAKHSRASRVTIRLRKGDHGIEFAVEDNGIGFDPEEAFARRTPWGGLGLLNIKARTELSGGTFTIESANGKGTAIRATWPI